MLLQTCFLTKNNAFGQRFLFLSNIIIKIFWKKIVFVWENIKSKKVNKCYIKEKINLKERTFKKMLLKTYTESASIDNLLIEV